MTATLQPAYSFFYAPDALQVEHGLDAEAAITAVGGFIAFPLNPQQLAAIRQSFSKRLSLLWGPPGTGKTWNLAALITAWLEAGELRNSPISILVGAANYNAIDNVLVQLRKLIGQRANAMPIDILRVRSDSSEPLGEGGIVDLTRAEAEMQCGSWMSPCRSVVVGGTYQQLLKMSRNCNADRSVGGKYFDLLVLDEASQVSTASAMAYACLAKTNAHLVVCGDHCQLGPVRHVKLDDSKEGLLESVFAFFKEHHKIELVSLSENYRSNEAITGWPSRRFYEDGFDSVNKKRRLVLDDVGSLPVKGWPAQMPWSPDLGGLLDPDQPVCVVTYDDRTCTVSNPFEAQIAAAIMRAYFLKLQMVDPSLTPAKFWADKAGLVTPHRAQIATIRNLLGEDLMPASAGLSFVDTVDRFQGQERDLVVASYTVSDPDFISGEEGFILDSRRFNVTLTRARAKFVLLVSQTLMSHLPGDLDVANDAAHMQLFTDHYCGEPTQIVLPYRSSSGATAQRECFKYVRPFSQDA